jgi:predicted transposase YdaD
LSKPFDVTTKYLLQADPAAWLTVASLVPDGAVSVLDSDLSTLSAAADALIRIEGPEPWLAHIEFQSTNDDLLAWRLLRYNVLSSDRHQLPVVSVVILLRPEADHRSLNGVFQARLPSGPVVLEFHYRVVRVWEVPVETILHGELATLPLVQLADLGNEELPRLVQQLIDRIDREASVEKAAEFWTATHILMGLRYTAEETELLLQGVRAMRESVTFQAILKEGMEKGLEQGRLQEAVNVVMRLGSKRFGPADSSTRNAIEQITDLRRIDQFIDRLHEVKSWNELLAPPEEDNGND